MVAEERFLYLFKKKSFCYVMSNTISKTTLTRLKTLCQKTKYNQFLVNKNGKPIFIGICDVCLNLFDTN